MRDNSGAILGLHLFLRCANSTSIVLASGNSTSSSTLCQRSPFGSVCRLCPNQPSGEYHG